NRYHGNQTRTIGRRCAVHANYRLKSGGALKETVEVRRWCQRPAVHLEEIVALRYLNARCAQRRLQLGIPVLTAVDLLDSVLAVLDREVGAQESDVDRIFDRHIAAAR